jgi:hypothetical protein
MFYTLLRDSTSDLFYPLFYLLQQKIENAPVQKDCLMKKISKVLTKNYIFKFLRGLRLFDGLYLLLLVPDCVGLINNVSCFFVIPANHKWSIIVH